MEATPKATRYIISQRVHALYHGRETTRYHTRPALRPQTDGHHMHAVAVLVWSITGGMCSQNLLMAALTHDLAEYAVGDMPYPTKRRHPTVAATLDRDEVDHLHAHGYTFDAHLSEEERTILSLADMMEAALYAQREIELGNARFHEVRTAALNSCKRRIGSLPPIYRLTAEATFTAVSTIGTHRHMIENKEDSK